MSLEKSQSSMRSKRIRILFIIGQLNYGGAERQLIYLAKHLQKDRYKIMVCVLSNVTPLMNELIGAGIDVLTLPRKLKPDLTRLWRLGKVVSDYQPDLIHSSLFVANFWSRVIGCLLGIPVVVSERNSDPKRNKFKIIINRLLASSTALLIANSKSGLDRAINRKETKPETSQVIHNGIAIDPYRGNSQESDIKTELGFMENQSVVGIIGRICEQKDQENFFQAMKIVNEKMPDVGFICVGGGKGLEELKAFVKDLGIHSATVFTGVRDDVPAILKIMDILVLSSRWEGLPNVIMEAMASSLPVISTHVGGVPEIVQDGITGLLVPPENPSEIASAVMRLLRDPFLARKMGSSGRIRIEKNFSIEKMVALTENAYRNVLYKN